MRPVTMDSDGNPLRPILSEKQDNRIFRYPLSSLCHGFLELERRLEDTQCIIPSNKTILPVMPARKDLECCQ